MSSPSISVMNCGKAFNLASHLRQSYSVAQYSARACTVASCTPCVASGTVSRSGHRVALMRLRNSVSSASGTPTRNGRITVVSLACSLRCAVAVGVMVSSSCFVLAMFPMSGYRNPDGAHCRGGHLAPNSSHVPCLKGALKVDERLLADADDSPTFVSQIEDQQNDDADEQRKQHVPQ